MGTSKFSLKPEMIIIDILLLLLILLGMRIAYQSGISAEDQLDNRIFHDILQLSDHDKHDQAFVKQFNFAKTHYKNDNN